MQLIFRFLIIFFLFLPTFSSAKSDIEIAGDYLQILLPLYGLYLGVKNDDTKGMVDFAKSYSSTFVATHFLKHTVKRLRPDNSDTKSFPSGHTSSAFSGAFFVSSRYYNTTQSVVMYSLASFVAYSRVHAKKHHISDVLAGALLSYGFNKYFINSRFSMSASLSEDKSALYANWVY